MQVSNTIISFLNKDGPTSGSELGDALGISRMAVQKKIQSLIDLGIPITASRGVGYELDHDVTLLDADTIQSLLIPSVAELVGYVDVFQSIESTNSYLLSQSFENAKAKVCLAETQSAGRGRRGSDWESAPYRNIMLSVSWRFDHWPATITGLSLAVGLVVAEYLNAEYDAGITIKWPNDILSNKDKLGGILVDVAGESTGACNVVVGLGLNVHQPNWATEAEYQWQDLKGLGITVDRNVLAADLISVISAMLSEFTKSGFTPLTQRWNSLSSYAGKTIRIQNEHQDIVGKMVGVDELGGLIVECDGEQKRIDDSGVSVRMVAGE